MGIISAWRNSTSSKSKRSQAKFKRKNRKQGQLLSESGFVLCIAPPSLSRDRRMKVKKSSSSRTVPGLNRTGALIAISRWLLLLCQLSPEIEWFIAIAQKFLPILGVINAFSSPLEKYWGDACIPPGFTPLVIIKTSDYDIKNSIVMQKASGLLEPLKLNVARDLPPLRCFFGAQSCVAW